MNAASPSRRKVFRPIFARNRLALLPAFALLLGALNPFAAAPAAAATLVSNIGQSIATGTSFRTVRDSYAQGFTTGSFAQGYILSGIDVRIRNAGTSGVEHLLARFKAELWSSTSAGAPNAKLVSLKPPTSSSPGQVLAAWTAPTGTRLAADTSYHLVLYNGSLDNNLLLPTSAAEDSGGAAGWSIANNPFEINSVTLASGTWTAQPTSPLMIRVNGSQVGAVTPPAAPTAVAAAATGFDALTLTWTAPTGTVTDYDVHYTSSTTVANDAAAGTDEAAGWVAVSRAAGDTSVSQTISGLSGGAVRRIRVRAANAGFGGGWAFALGAPTSKPAGTVWTATLNVQDLTDSTDNGCNNSIAQGAPAAERCSASTTLSEDEFTVGGATYRITSTAVSPTGYFQTRLSANPNAALQALNFCVGSTAVTKVTSNDLQKSGSGLSWSPGDQVQLSIGSTCPTATASTTPVAVALSASPNLVAEGGATTVTVSLDKAALAKYRVYLTESGASTASAQPATRDYQFAGDANYIDIEQGAKTGTITLSALSDGRVESEETIVIDIDDVVLHSTISTTPTEVSTIVTKIGTVVRISEVAPVEVTLTATPNPVAEGSSVTVTATLSSALATDVSIPATVTAGTAEPEDYTTALTSFDIFTGNTSAQSTINTNQDVDADDETIIVALGSPLPAGLAAGNSGSVTININDDDTPPSTDAGLRALAVSGATSAAGTYTPQTFAPTFSGNTLAYRAEVPNDLTHITVTPTVSDSGRATIEAGLSNSLQSVVDGTASAAIALAEGENRINVKVTAEDTITIRTYTVTVMRMKAPSALELSANPQEIPQGRMSTITATLDAPALSSGATVTFTFNGDAVRGSGADADYDVDTDTITIKGSQLSGEFTITASPNARVDRSIILTASVTTGSLSFSTTQELEITFTAARMERLHEAVLPEVARAVAGRVTGAISARVGQALNGGGTTASASLGGQSSLAGVLKTHAPGLVNDNRPLRDLLSGSRFVLPLSGDGGGGSGLRSASLWGSGEYRNLSGEDGDLEFDGSLYGAQLGVDAKVRDNLLVGMALSWSDGEFEYESGSDGASSMGDYEVDVISLHPYLSGHIEQFDWWATFGYGSGEVVVTPDSDQATSNDLSMATLGVGGSGVLWSRNDTRVHLKGEFTRTQMDVDRSAEVDSLSVKTDLARIALAASRTRSLAGGGQMSPSLSLGVRQDGGDGNTGSGAEIGGSVRYDNAESGVSASVSAHGLFGRSDYEEWGVQGMVRLSPGADGQGLSFVMSPGYGNGGTGVGDGGRIWSTGLRGDAIPTAHDPNGRLEMRLGYGLSTPGGRDGLLTPWSGLTLQDNGKQYRLGLDWASNGQFTLRLHGERRENENADADHAVVLKGEARF